MKSTEVCGHGQVRGVLLQATDLYQGRGKHYSATGQSGLQWGTLISAAQIVLEH
jgi:hypothetical protein